MSPSDDRRVYFSSFQLMRVADGGHTAHELDGNVVHVDHHALWIDPTEWQPDDPGQRWRRVRESRCRTTWRYLNNLPIGQFYMVAADSRQPFRLCGGLQDNNAWCGPSNNLVEGDGSGAEWYTVTGGDGEYAVPAPSDSNIVYVDSQNGIRDAARSQDGRVAPHPSVHAGRRDDGPVRSQVSIQLDVADRGLGD